VEDGDEPVEIMALPASVTRVSTTGDPVPLARVLTGHQTAHAGELVVDGLLLPEQRGLVGERACLVRVPSYDGPDLLEDRAALVPARHRQEFVRRTQELVDELAQGLDSETDSPVLHRAVVELALGLAAGADLAVLADTDLAPEDRARLEMVAAGLARRGLTVVQLVGAGR
jgi:hypothetical protein